MKNDILTLNILSFIAFVGIDFLNKVKIFSYNIVSNVWHCNEEYVDYNFHLLLPNKILTYSYIRVDDFSSYNGD